MSSRFYDGSYAAPTPNRPKRISFPLAHDLEYYAFNTDRNYLAAATAYDPQLMQRNTWTNLAIASDDLTNAAWTLTGATAAANATTDPEGGTAIASLAESSATSAHNAAQAITAAAGATSAGVFVSAAGRNYVRLRLHNATDGDFASAVFNLSGGTLVSGTGSIAVIPKKFFWITVTGTSTVANPTCYLELSSDGVTWSYSGTTGLGIYAARATVITGGGVFPAIQTTSASRSVTVPLVDTDDPLSFLVSEAAPNESSLEIGIADWARTFSRVPSSTSVPTSIVISKPSVPAANSLASLPIFRESPGVFFMQLDAITEQFDIYAAALVVADSGPVTVFFPTGGTYNIAFTGGQTVTAISYAATSGLIQTYLNSLTSVSAFGGVTVTGSYNQAYGLGFNVVFNPIATLTVTINAGATSAIASGTGWSQGLTLGGITATWTITILGQTTAAISATATAANVASALNALSNVTAKGGVTVTGGPITGNAGSFLINFTIPLLTGAGTYLTPAGGAVTSSSLNLVTNEVQQLNLKTPVARYVNAPNHGITASGQIFIRSTYAFPPYYAASYSFSVPSGVSFLSATMAAIGYFAPITNYTVVDSNNIIINVRPSDSYWAGIITLGLIGPRTFQNYQAAPVNVRALRNTSYWLPNFSVGISTYRDIPILKPQSDPVDFFQALASTAGTINYDVGTMELYEGPIIARQVVAVSKADIF